MEVELIKVLVGSQAHKLANEFSDYDYRGVFALPTTEILKVGAKNKKTRWIEGKQDDTSWEVEHFLMMATKSNPTVLEVFLSPVVNDSKWSKDLQALFPHIWSSVGVYNAFKGYGLNQRKKMLEDKEGKSSKFAAAYLRTLVSGYELLTTGKFTIQIGDTPTGKIIKKCKEGDYSTGEVIDVCREWEMRLEHAYYENPDKETNMDAVNEFLLDLRKSVW